MPRENNFELWYVGERNVPKSKYADRRGLPIYYSADWDKDGLEIFDWPKGLSQNFNFYFQPQIHGIL